jgi:UDP-N-acetyl-D-glucosamine dehydrogenase
MKKIAIVGLGFVGAAMSVAIASKLKKKKEKFIVYGFEQNNKQGRDICNSFIKGKFPFDTTDSLLLKKTKEVIKNKDLIVTTNKNFLSDCSIIVIDINLDLKRFNESLKNYKKSIIEISKFLKDDVLIIIETTLPPGFCNKIIYPIIKKEFLKKHKNLKKLKFAHSYERVMPGKNYIKSITDYFRVYSGANNQSAIAAENFFKSFINTKKYPLCKLDKLEESEFAKILENTYRTVNIALIEEWRSLGEELNIDLFNVIDAIRHRKTHKNIMLPGYGVGGYCLTKDPLFGKISSKKFYNNRFNFPLTQKAMNINKKMPLTTLSKIKKIFNNLNFKKILLLGISYKSDVSDTRDSQSKLLYDFLKKNNSILTLHDPLVKYWKETSTEVLNKIPNLNEFDLVVFLVNHDIYKKINFNVKIKNKKTIIFDANGVLNKKQIDQIKKKQIRLLFNGR